MTYKDLCRVLDTSLNLLKKVRRGVVLFFKVSPGSGFGFGPTVRARTAHQIRVETARTTFALFGSVVDLLGSRTSEARETAEGEAANPSS